MARQSRFSPDTFLAGVQSQLKGLDPGEQREILEELRGHLEDAAPGFTEEGGSREAALERAAAGMGDPAEVGRRIREEHMAKTIPWRYGFLAAIPLLAVALSLELGLILIYFLVPRGENPGSLMVAFQAVTLLFVLSVGVWSWRKRRRFAIAPFAGIAMAYILSTSWKYLSGPWAQSGLHSLVAPWVPVVSVSRPNDPVNSWLVVGPWVVVALAFLPAVSLLTWWGRLAGGLTILGGIGILAIFNWTDSPMSWLKLFAILAICLGPTLFTSTRRSAQPVVVWLILLADWTLVALGKWYFIVYEAPHAMNERWRATHLPTLEGVWGEMPLAVLAFSVLLLLSMQLLVSRRSNRSQPLAIWGR